MGQERTTAVATTAEPLNSSHDKATPLSAILLVFATGILFSCLDTSAKYLVVSGMSAPFVSWARFFAHVVFVFLLFQGWRNAAIFRFRSLPLQILRGAFLFGSTVFNFQALKTLQLAETQSIAFFAPMLITALAGPLLGEWAGWRRWLAVLVGFVGVLVITRPGYSAFGLGHVFALCSTLSYSFYVMMTRRLGATESSQSLIFYSALAPAVLMAPIAPFTASMPPSVVHWALLIGLGFFGGFGHWLLIKAYQQASTTALAPYPYLGMVWMIISGYLVFDQLPDMWTLIGAAIIVGSGLYIVHREHRLRLRDRSMPNAEDSELAKKL